MFINRQAIFNMLHMKPPPAQLTNRQRVLRQYKAVLVTLKDHAGSYRDLYYDDVGEARAQFELHRHKTDPEEIEYRIQQGEAWLEKYKHWAPYRLPYLPDGTKYQRNPILPEEICHDDRCVDFEAEVRNEFDSIEINPTDPKRTWKLDL